MTSAEDGDALDVLVIGDASCFPGCLLTGKLIGTISGEQTEKKKTIRNDRLLAVPITPVNPARITVCRGVNISPLNAEARKWQKKR